MQTVLLRPISDAGPNGYGGAAAGQQHAAVDAQPGQPGYFDIPGPPVAGSW